MAYIKHCNFCISTHKSKMFKTLGPEANVQLSSEQGARVSLRKEHRGQGELTKGTKGPG